MGRSIVTDLVFIVAPIAAAGLAWAGKLTGDQALGVVIAAMGYAAGRPVTDGVAG